MAARFCLMTLKNGATSVRYWTAKRLPLLPQSYAAFPILRGEYARIYLMKFAHLTMALKCRVRLAYSATRVRYETAMLFQA